MSEPLKNIFNEPLIQALAGHIKRVHPPFADQEFVACATEGLSNLELKQRSQQISRALWEFLPEDFAKSCNILVRCLHPQDDVGLRHLTMDEEGVRGWAIMPMADYIAEYGIADFARSMSVLQEFTKRFSAEFAVRRFIITDPQQAFALLYEWAQHPNYHVRRLASEGARPRLPWGQRIPQLVADPSPLLPILECLKDDPSEYVRRSVANNLNDIAKDHPEVVVALAKKWLSHGSLQRQRLVKHACRGLIKQGHTQVLEALGYGAAQLSMVDFSVEPKCVRFGGDLALTLRLRSRSPAPQTVLVDFVVWFLRRNGRHSEKVFKWKSVVLPVNETFELNKVVSFKRVTTRTYYAGTHSIEVQINGQRIARQDFRLIDDREG